MIRGKADALTGHIHRTPGGVNSPTPISLYGILTAPVNSNKKRSCVQGGEDLADYKKMYLTAMDAMEKAVELLTAAQQRCEDIYVETGGEETELFVMDTERE